MNMKIIIITSIVLLILFSGYLVYNIVTQMKEKEKEKDDQKLFKSSRNQQQTSSVSSIKNASQTVLSEGLIILGALAIADFIKRLINIYIPSKNKKHQLLVQFGIMIFIIGLAILSLFLLNLTFQNEYKKL
jgi:Ca2+/Na+ antiporter